MLAGAIRLLLLQRAASTQQVSSAKLDKNKLVKVLSWCFDYSIGREREKY
jgi:hypothetical protein